MRIAHTAFIDLENALGQRVGNGWTRMFQPIQEDLLAAIAAKNWAKANQIVANINADELIAINFNFAKTIAVSALLLGASRLGEVTDSHVVKNPPEHQIQNALTQWGFIVSRNAVQNVQLSLHLMLARLEHEAHMQHQMITNVMKADPYHDERGRFTFSEEAGSVSKLNVRTTSDLLADKDSGQYQKIETIFNPTKSELARFASGEDGPEWLRGLRLDGGKIVWWDGNAAIHVQIIDALRRAGVKGVMDPSVVYNDDATKYDADVIGPAERDLILHDINDDGSYSLSRHGVKKDESDDPDQYADDPNVLQLIDSIRVDGANFMSLAANLMVSRLSSFGFLLEAQQSGRTSYEISAVLDDHTCPVCESLDGQIFPVADGVSQAASIMEADDADSLKSIAPWPSQSKASVSRLQNTDTQGLVDMGLALPPYHAGCRCITVDHEDDEDTATDEDVEADAVAALAEDELPDVSEDEISAILGLVLVPDELEDMQFPGEDDEEDPKDTTEEDVDDTDQELDEAEDPEQDAIDDAEENPPKKRKRPVAKIDPYHDPKTGEFTSGPGGGNAARLLAKFPDNAKDYSKLETMPTSIDGFPIKVRDFGPDMAMVMAETRISTGEIAVNSGAPAWKDPEEPQKMYDEDWMSSPDKNHTLYHEVGHAHWVKEVSDELRRTVDDVNPYSGNATFNRLAPVVSKYAATSGPEFIAEVYAGLRSGRIFSLPIMSLYHVWGGPEV